MIGCCMFEVKPKTGPVTKEGKTRRFLFVFGGLLLAYATYWYVYGRERDLLEGTEVVTLPASFLDAPKDDENQSKRLSDLTATRSFALSTALKGRLSLTPNGSGGSTLSGTLVSGKQG